jgi:ABC-2 type transport system permease protein
MKSFVYLLNAGFREFVRDRTAVFFTLVFPIMFILVFGLFFGSQDDTGAYPVGVVLEDEDDQAALGFFCMFEMADREDEGEPAISADDLELCAPWFEQAQATGLPATGGLFETHAASESGENPGPTPRLPLYILRGSLDEELENLQNADRRAVIVFPAGFGTQVEQRLSGGEVMANVEVYYDASQTTTAQIVNQVITSLLDFYDRQLSGSAPLIETEFKSTTAEGFNFMDFFVPGVVAMSLMQLGIFGSLTMVSLRERKILKRLGATPLPRRTLVLSQVVLRLIIAVVQTFIILTVGRLAFGVQIGNQVVLMVAFILLGGLSFVAMGYLVASFARTEAAGQAIVQVIQFPMMFLSGIFWPIEFAPDWLEPVIKVMPLTYLGDALRQVMVEGSSKLFPLPVDAAVLTGWLLVSLFVAFRFFRWE